MMYHIFEQDEEAHASRRELERFFNVCQLDVFISVCCMDYISTDTADTTFYVQEVCNEISKLSQLWNYGKVRTFMNTTEYLYQMF